MRGFFYPVVEFRLREARYEVSEISLQGLCQNYFSWSSRRVARRLVNIFTSIFLGHSMDTDNQYVDRKENHSGKNKDDSESRIWQSMFLAGLESHPGDENKPDSGDYGN